MKKLCLAMLFAVTVGALFAQNAVLPRLAVVSFTTNINNEKTRADAITVRNLVESRMVATGRYTIITRDEIDKLLENQRIQVSAISSTENIKILRLENISYIITGSLDAMGNDYAVTVRVLDVSTGQYSYSDSELMGSASRELFNGVTGLMARFVSGMSADGDRVVQAQENRITGATAIYSIGDIGPAGGIIFYDKGSFSENWRYLEAAPANMEFKAEWGTTNGEVRGTSTEIGSGRRNTQLILEALRANNENGKAAQRVAQLSINGFIDWFLPSRDELDLMYKNLHQRGLGGFKENGWDGYYWSSSDSDSGYYAWGQNFSGDGFGRPYTYRKPDTYSVRPVRAF